MATVKKAFNCMFKAFLYIIKISALSLLLYLLSTVGIYLLLFLVYFIGIYVLAVIPAVAFGYLMLAVCLSELGMADRKKGKKMTKRIISSMPVLIPSVILGLLILWINPLSQHDKQPNSHPMKSNEVYTYYSQADEVIAIDYSAKRVSDGMMGTPFHDPKIMIDYDTMSVCFVFGNNDYPRYTLSKDVPEFAGLSLQSEKSLSSPGKAFRTYSQNDSFSTSGIEIELENGEIWRAAAEEKIFKYQLDYPILLKAVRNCDKRIEYLDSECHMNGVNIAHPSILFDYDNMYGYIVFYDRDRLYLSYICCSLTEYDYKTNDIPEMEIIAKIEMESPWKEVYVYRREDEDSDKQLGLALLSEDGKLYLGDKNTDDPRRFSFKTSKYTFSGDSSDILKSLGVS